MLKETLLTVRDARWMWDLLGPVYNYHIYRALREFYEEVARLAPSEGPGGYLDVGTGRGYMALQLARIHRAASVVGIDHSITQVRSAERLRRKWGVGNASFRQADALRLPFEDESFHGAVSVGSVKHWHDPKRGLAEIHRVLKPGGWLILSEVDPDVTDGELRRFMKRLSPYRPLDPLLFRGLRSIIFGESFSREVLSARVAGAGFEDIAASTAGTCPYIVLTARKGKGSSCI
jgi:ubiquinone/menaquinone biosynthesis C-methylase UbiE